jgi:hypothetical protein
VQRKFWPYCETSVPGLAEKKKMASDIQITGSDITTVVDEGQFCVGDIAWCGLPHIAAFYLLNSVYLFGNMRDLRDVVS